MGTITKVSSALLKNFLKNFLKKEKMINNMTYAEIQNHLREIIKDLSPDKIEQAVNTLELAYVLGKNYERRALVTRLGLDTPDLTVPP